MRTALSLALLFVAGLASAGEVSFAARPTARRDGDKTIISFAVSREADVAVCLENAKGEVLRHLVAGVLGKNPPPPLKPDSLEQSIAWDGQDDAGKAATGGPFRARVVLGLEAQFDGFLLHNPDASGVISAVAAGPGGTLYVFHLDGTSNSNMGGYKIRVYSRNGRAVRSLTPFPADIAPERVRALGVFRTPGGKLVPRVHNWETLSFYPDSIGHRGRDMPEHSSPAVDSKGRVYWLVNGPSLVAVDPDGGIPYEAFLGPRLLPEIKGLKLAAETWVWYPERPSLAVSSDDRYVYFAGLSIQTGPLPCVFRVPAETRGPAEVFVGRLAEPGREKELLTAPRGLAVAGGLLYVADYQADRVAVFRESDRAYTGEIKVKAPDTLGVEPASGAVYVCSVAAKPSRPDVIKFDGYKEGKELYRIAAPPVGEWAKQPVHRIAVDASAKPVLLWLPTLPYTPHRLVCIEDTGEKLVMRGDPRSKDLWVEGPRDLTVDRLRGELYVKGNEYKLYRLDEKTGEVRRVIDVGIRSTAHGTQFVPGSDGNLYTFSWGLGLLRFDREGKPLNWDGLNIHRIPIGGVMNFQQRTLALKPFAPPSEMYLIAPPFYRLIQEEGMKEEEAAKQARGRYTSLNVIGQDGKTRRTVVWQCLDGAIPRLDAQGNIYLADLVKPPDRYYPEFFDGKLDAPPKECGGGDRFWYSYMYGSVVKFPPTGGIIWFKKGLLPKSCLGQPPAELLAQPKVPIRSQYGYTTNVPGELQGALWYRFGYSPYSCGTSGMTNHCMCEGSGFDVDPFGRVFFPNLGQFRIEVIDTNNNPICTFGQYGNEDFKAGPGKPPDIPLAWPVYVAVSDTHAYVADTVNRRVVRVRLAHAAEESTPIP